MNMCQNDRRTSNFNIAINADHDSNCPKTVYI